ncbi:MAG: sensor histidine kinase [Rhodocyclaceae bacterium]|nr:sensor histidine kinase [Rhodocyclaceae bacterium]
MSKDSLYYRLLRRLLISANVAILLLLPVIYQIFKSYAIEAYDVELSEAAFSLEPYLVSKDGVPDFVLPAEAEQAFRSDSYDEEFYLVLGPHRHAIAGDTDLPVEIKENAWHKQSPYVFYDTEMRGKPVRAVALRHIMDGQVYLLLAAETLNKRQRIQIKIMLGLILPLFMLALVNGLAIWRGIRLSLAPIEDIRAALQGMQHGRLHPLEENAQPTEIRPLVQEFNALLTRMDAAALAQQQFVANAAHQLRTPLAGVRTQLEVVRSQIEETELQSRVNRSIEAIDRLNHLVQQMLSLLTAAPGARDVSTVAVVDVSEVVQQRSSEWVRTAALRNIDLGFELSHALVRGDSLLIGEMIANLVDNAIIYAPDAGRVTVRCRIEGECAIIEVEDNGQGIPVEERERVFQRFYRLPGVARKGSGLGLAIVAEIVQGLHGAVRILKPITHAGCLVRVSLPLDRPLDS